MKLPLPEDPAERKKILVLIGIFGMGFLYLLVQFALLPYFAAIRSNKERLVELEELIWKAERDIQQASPNRQRNQDNIERILDISETKRHILRPSLGNYLLVAESILHNTAEQTSITIEGIREVPSSPPARATGKAAAQAPVLWPYTVNLTFQAGLHDVTRFVHILQNQNPYLAITSMVIQGGGARNPGQHSINMMIQWPIWRDPDHPNRLSAELLADGEQS